MANWWTVKRGFIQFLMASCLIIDISHAETQATERRAVIPQDATRKLTCDESHPFVTVKSAKYAEPHGTIRAGQERSDTCTVDYTGLVRRFCRKTSGTCQISAKTSDLQKPCQSSKELRLIVVYTCEAANVGPTALRSAIGALDPMCSLMPFSTYCDGS